MFYQKPIRKDDNKLLKEKHYGILGVKENRKRKIYQRAEIKYIKNSQRQKIKSYNSRKMITLSRKFANKKNK
jgi:hypothetical protein